MGVRLLFPDGLVVAGDDAAGALAALAARQWTPTDIPGMRALLSDRAWAWSRTAVDPLLPDDEFLTALDAAGICKVDYVGTPTKPAPWRWPPPLDLDDDEEGPT